MVASRVSCRTAPSLQALELILSGASRPGNWTPFDFLSILIP